jgi:hypothetical protein
MSKFIIEEQTDSRVIIAVEHAGKRWEIDVRADFGLDGGLMVDIARDGIICTGAEFDWDSKHDNEPRD